MTFNSPAASIYSYAMKYQLVELNTTLNVSNKKNMIVKTRSSPVLYSYNDFY